MTTCLICKCDISQPLQQFGKPNVPMCQSCWLNGDNWVYGEEVLVDSLVRGLSLDEACQAELDERNKEFEKGMQELAGLFL